MAHRAITGGHGAGGGGLVSQLARMTGESIMDYIRHNNRQQMLNVIGQIADNARRMGRSAMHRWSEALNELGSENPQYKEYAQQLRAVRAEDSVDGSRDNRERQVAERRNAEVQNEENVSTDEPEQEEMQEDGNYAGSGGGHTGGKSNNGKWMVTPDNRWLGPGLLAGVPTNKQTITMETPLLKSPVLELKEGDIHNLLAQNFTVEGGIGTNWTNIASTDTTGITDEWEAKVYKPDSHILQWLDKPTAITSMAAGSMGTTKPNGFWKGYLPGNGARCGTIGSIRPWVTWKYTRQRQLIEALFSEYKFCRLKSQTIIISDMKAWGESATGTNLSHDITEDKGTILMPEIQQTRSMQCITNLESEVEANAGLLTMVPLYAWKCPNFKKMLIQKKVPQNWQTGWTGGDFTTSKEFKPH